MFIKQTAYAEVANFIAYFIGIKSLHCVFNILPSYFCPQYVNQMTTVLAGVKSFYDGTGLVVLKNWMYGTVQCIVGIVKLLKIVTILYKSISSVWFIFCG